jgi:hypothetical protein
MGQQDVLCAIPSPRAQYVGWLITSMRICNGQQSSEISCDKDVIDNDGGASQKLTANPLTPHPHSGRQPPNSGILYLY